MKHTFLRFSMVILLAIVGFVTTIGSGGGSEGGSEDSSSSDIVVPDPEDNGNTRPVASPISLQIDSSSPNVEINLIARDADGDTLQYELLAPTSGDGYTLAYLDPSYPTLYVTLESNFSGIIELPYRATDGYLFSKTVDVTLQVGSNTTSTEFGMGLIFADPKNYASLPTAQFGIQLFGAPGEAPILPRSVDLSSNFPTPGNQGQQGSCTAWATAYALKSYQERLEMGWSLNTSEHLFSPAFIYNQIYIEIEGKESGSYIEDALKLIRDKGAATLATMPYNSRDYRTQPNPQAIQEAAKYKAASFEKLNDTQSIKAALANRSPVVGAIIVYGYLQSRTFRELYNSTAGGFLDSHAITITGYNDDKYGGAFEIINSWGKDWGNNGYFWMPYTFANSAQSTPDGTIQMLSEVYILKRCG